MSNIEKNNNHNRQKLIDAAAEQWVNLVLQQISFRKDFSKQKQLIPLKRRRG